MRPLRCQTAEWSTMAYHILRVLIPYRSALGQSDAIRGVKAKKVRPILRAVEIKPPRKVCKFGQKPNRHTPLPPSSRLLEYTRPLSSVQTSLRPWPGPPDRKLINECKRGNVVDKFNKIVHAQLVSPGVNTFWWAVPFPTCRNPQLLALPENDRKLVKFYNAIGMHYL